MPRNTTKYPARFAPSKELVAEWRTAAQHLGFNLQKTTAYLSKWKRFWNGVLDELRDQGTWEDRDIRLLEEFVEWRRKADFHHRMAAAEPYTTHAESGRTFAHPGWKLEQEALRESRIVAEQLMLGELEPDDQGDDDGPPT